MGESSLTVIMYHYVRPLEQTRYPKLKAKPLSQFKSQLAYIERRFQPVTVQQLSAYFREGEHLPSNAVLLTFDDGYLDHYAYVFPLLYDAGIQGAFFPVVRSSRDRELLDITRIHLILASTEDGGMLVEEINRFLLENNIVPEPYWLRYGKPSRFDDANVAYVKQMLQVALPETIRAELGAKLFKKFVTTDEQTLAREWYMDMDQLRTMQRCGMYIGAHGATHRRLSSLSPEMQQKEIEESLLFLRELGSPVDDHWVLSYPSGAYDETTRTILGQHSCSFGLTTEVGVAELRECDPLLLPRLDTNDLPIC